MSVRARGASMLPWWLFLVTGLAWLLISLIVLRFDITSIAAVGAPLGVVFLMAGVNEFVLMGARPGWRWAHAVLGVLFIVGSIWAFVHPLDAFYELAAILGFLLLLKGSFDIAVAFMTREVNDLWWLRARRGDPRGVPSLLGLAAAVRAARRADPGVGRVRGDVPRVHRDLPRVRGSEAEQGAVDGKGTGSRSRRGRVLLPDARPGPVEGTEAS